jgi:ComF family protein
MSLLLDLLFPKTCYFCGRPGCYFCPSCNGIQPTMAIVPNPLPPLSGLLSLFPYRPPLRRALLDLKYYLVTDLVDELSRLVICRLTSDYPHLLSYWSQNRFTLVPVPLHPFRQNWRGFNQSVLFVRRLSTGLNLDYADCLQRIKSSPSQTQVNPQDRPQNVSRAFRLAANPPSRVILFDDVYTTGSTLASAAGCFPSSTTLWGLTIAS